MKRKVLDMVVEHQRMIHEQIRKVEKMDKTPSVNSARILLQRAYSAASANDIERSKELYEKAMECIEYGVSYF
jgi:hypothetical protein